MKKFMIMLAAVLCCAMTTTVFTACGSDDDDTPQYALYSHSNHTLGLYINGQTLDYHLAMYMINELAHQTDKCTPEENLAYFIDSSIKLADSYIEKTGGVPVDVSKRDNEVIEYYDIAFNKIPADSKALLKGKFEVYRSVNGSRMETIKVYSFE